MSTIPVNQRVLIKNDTIADEIRSLLKREGIVSINLIGSPGSGKTALLEAVFRHLGSSVRAAVVEGDVKTDNDTKRITALGIPAVQIETHNACHLNAAQVKNALSGFRLTNFNLLIVENVGNLICPVAYDLGENRRAIVLSVTEGEDKPLKYPSAFISADAVIITKSDLSPYVDVGIASLKDNALSVNPNLDVIVTSAKTGEGIDLFADYLTSIDPE